MNQDDSILLTAMSVHGAAAILDELRDDPREAPPGHPRPLDAFAFRHVLRMTERSWQVVDATAKITGGAFALLAAAEPRAVAIDYDAGDAAPLLARLLLRHGWQGRIGHVAASQEDNVLVVLAVDEPHAWQSAIEQTFQKWPNATLVVHPIGKIGSCPALAALLRCAEARPSWNVHAVREAQPLLGECRLGILTPRPEMARVLVRLGQLFHGNFQFADMIQRLVKTTHEYAELKQKLIDAEAKLDVAQLRLQEIGPLFGIGASRTYRVARMLHRARHRIAPRGGLAARTARFMINAARRILASTRKVAE